MFSNYLKEKDNKKILYSNISDYIYGNRSEKNKEKIVTELNKKYKPFDKNFSDIFKNVDTYVFEDKATEHIYNMFKKIKDKKGFKNRFNGESICFDKGNYFEDIYSLYKEDKNMFGKTYMDLDSTYYYLDIDYDSWELNDSKCVTWGTNQYQRDLLMQIILKNAV